jgi:hypothetical protein
MRWAFLLAAIVLTLSACSFFQSEGIKITDAKTVLSVDEKLMPIEPTSIFPKSSSKVVCWFQWKDAAVNTQIMAKWHYVTDDIHILDYPFSIPKKMGSGSVALSAPEGKTLPVGQYKIELVTGNHSLKSLTFTIE